MPTPSRREAIHSGLVAFLAACADSSVPMDTGDPIPTGLTFIGLVPFVGEDPRTFDVLTGTGLDGRLVTDLSTLDAGALVIDNDRFYVRTARSSLFDSAGATVQIAGRVAAPVTLEIADIRARAVSQGVLHFECSGNSDFGGFGLMGAAEWTGAPLADLLAEVTPDPGADWVRITGFDTYPGTYETSEAGASWVFRRSDLEAAGAFLATGMNGEDLPEDHGYPVRLVVPGWYGCCNIKWVEEIALVGADEPATGHMKEFAQRTLQIGVPELAADFIPAINDVAATPVRVEQWQDEAGTFTYRVVGVTWGGPVPANVLRIFFGDDDGTLVSVVPPRTDGRGWSLWELWWTPATPGTVDIAVAVDDAAIQTRRLDSGYYVRTVQVA